MQADILFLYEVWAVTISNKLICKQGDGTWENVKSGVQDVSVSENGKGVWIVTTSKILKRKTPQGWKTLKKEVEKVCVTASGKFIWVITSKNELLYKQKGKKWKKQGTDIIEVAVSEMASTLLLQRLAVQFSIKKDT